MIIRRASGGDAAEIGDIWLRWFAAGLPTVTRTDGARNEEREPDIRYAWKP